MKKNIKSTSLPISVKFFIACLFVAGLCAAGFTFKNNIGNMTQQSVAVSTATITHYTYIPQFVLLSFDGAKSVDIWKQTRALEDSMKAQGKPVNFTYFINAAYFLTPDKKDLYEAPEEPRGKVNISFASDTQDVAARIIEVNKAVAAGDEITSHTVGHFSGAAWSADEWTMEFNSFTDILFGTQKIYQDSGVAMPALTLKPSDIIGFRAPSLSAGPGLYQALHDAHVTYDSSEVNNGTTWPTKDSSGMWHIPLGTMTLDNGRGGKAPAIAMDYNVWAYQTKNQETLKKGTPQWQAAYDDTLSGFMGYFNQNYSGNRAPVLVGYHFENWNDGVYWEALKDFTNQVCGKPEVRCGTFKELVDYMNEYGVPTK